MYQFLWRTQRELAHCAGFGLMNFNNQLGLVQKTFFIARLLSSSSPVNKRPLKAEGNEQKVSFTVSYFVNSCGLSSKSAFLIAKRVCIKNKERADSVLRFLSNHGFTNTQISKVVRSCPKVVLANPERTLLPKIEFFRSIGVSRNDLAKMISSSPNLLAVSLKNHLIPNYNFLKNVVILDQEVVKVLKRINWALLRNLRTYMEPNIALLKEIGVPQSRISKFVIRSPSVAAFKPSEFCKTVNELKKMGFDPLGGMLLRAIAVSRQLNKSIWESKIDVYGRWGWSKDETLAAFKRHPYCMLISKEKITKTMDFFVNKMGWLSQDIAKRPVFLLLSLEKRIIPRCSVVQVLLSKGLIEKDFCPKYFLLPGEREFIERYVTKFQERVPQLLNVYEGKTDILNVRPASESEGLDVELMVSPKAIAAK